MSGFVVAVLVASGCVFLASSVAKLRGRAAFARFRAGLAGTSLVPSAVLGAVSVGLVVAESVAAVGALVAAAVLVAAVPVAAGVAAGALGLSVALLAALTAGVAVALRRGTRAPCACFGAGADSPIGMVHLVRNSCLLALAVAALVTVAAGGGHGTGVAGVFAVPVGAVAAMVFVRAQDVVELFSAMPAVSRGAHR